MTITNHINVSSIIPCFVFTINPGCTVKPQFFLRDSQNCAATPAGLSVQGVRGWREASALRQG